MNAFNPWTLPGIWQPGYRADGITPFTSDGVRFIFTREAVNMVGKARFGDEWTGLEFARAVEQPIPTSPNPLRDNIAFAEWVVATIKARHPERDFPTTTAFPTFPLVEGVSPRMTGRNAYRETMLDKIAKLPKTVPAITSLDSGEALKYHQEDCDAELAARKPMWERIGEVKELIKQHCLDLPNQSGVIQGGKLHWIPHLTWNGPTVHERFNTCRIDFQNTEGSIFSIPTGEGWRARWLFFDEAGIRQVCQTAAGLRAAAPQAASPPAISRGDAPLAKALASPEWAERAVKKAGGKLTLKRMAEVILKLAKVDYPGRTLPKENRIYDCLRKNWDEIEPWLDPEAITAHHLSKAGLAAKAAERAA